ncbi:hypothetical protein HPB48_007815 [Haemaphysalis longicornis]|uniref:Uncharacterized protein n=1 Tax=Haemaphysalis longicornis TaxID=44386 RepID=A0A9J6G214_HAELO|nr:hypothetical protein HPB48_007815 [Haemaphysalis longicornis]
MTADVPGSRVVGAVTDGVFVGHIALPPRDEFHVERASRYFGPRPRGFHSVIYSAKDAYAQDGRCGLHGATESFLNNLRRPRGQQKGITLRKSQSSTLAAHILWLEIFSVQVSLRAHVACNKSGCLIRCKTKNRRVLLSHKFLHNK